MKLRLKTQQKQKKLQMQTKSKQRQSDIGIARSEGNDNKTLKEETVAKIVLNDTDIIWWIGYQGQAVEAAVFFAVKYAIETDEKPFKIREKTDWHEVPFIL